MKPKVAIQNASLKGSSHPELLQTVACVYFDGQAEYKVLAPPQAKGDALDWISQFSVRQTSKEEFGSQIVVSDKWLADSIVKYVSEELGKAKSSDNIWHISENPSGRFYPAQICLRGHVLVSNGIQVIRDGEHCPKCGEKSVNKCLECNASIRGQAVYTQNYQIPGYCHNCGKPYAWMKERLDTAKELLDHDDKLTLEDREKLWDLLQYVISDPKSDLVPAKGKLISIAIGKAAGATREFVLDLMAKIGVEMMKS